jgi:hypothetical protein
MSIAPETEASLDALAKRIVSLKLETPAMLLLESHIPLLSTFQTMFLFFQPFIVPFTGTQKLNAAQTLLFDQAHAMRLIELIELHAMKKNSPEGAHGSR